MPMCTQTHLCLTAAMALLAPVLVASAQYESVVQNDNPLVYWRFEDAGSADGSVAQDTMGRLNGTYQGGVTLVDAGIGNRAARFDGDSTRIDLGFDLRDSLSGAPAVSIEAWVRNDLLPGDDPDNASYFLFQTNLDGGQTGARLAVNASDPRMNLGGRSATTDGFQSAGAAYSDTNTWRHVVGVMDYADDRIDVYIDGARTSTAIEFHSATYAPGATDTSRDTIGAFSLTDGDYDRHFDGLLDEVAVYGYDLGDPDGDGDRSDSRVTAHFNAASPAEPEALWKSQVNFSDASTGIYLGSPSVARVDAETLIASHDYFGPGAPENADGWLNTSAVHRSTDNGETWTHVTDFEGSFWPTAFVHDNAAYVIAERERYGSIVIRKSTDGGLTWTDPTDADNGLLRDGGTGFDTPAEKPNYFSGNNNMLIADGKIYRSFSDRDTLTWADGYDNFIMWADLEDDLLDADSWNATNTVSFPTGQFDAANNVVPGWQEGSVVQAPNGEIWNILRVNVGEPEDRDTAAILKMNANGTLSFNPETGFIDLPGASAGNFVVRRDPKTGLYVTLVNNIVNPEIRRQRNYLSLAVSEDLINWELVTTLLEDDQGLSVQESAAETGFQYVHWHFDGDDLIYLVRTAYDGANDYHDSNRITYHVLEDYATVVPEPATLALLGLGGLVLRRRRRRA